VASVAEHPRQEHSRVVGLANMKEAIIECRNLTKDYAVGEETIRVLKGISFTINKGDFVAITGPSGSGKSTMMHIIGALDTPTSGDFLINGHDVSKMSEDELASLRGNTIGFVFQSFNLMSRATVWRNVQLPLLYTDVPKEQRAERVKSSLTAAQFDETRYFNKSNQLSGGQMQRVAIARALVNNPDIILADEPTGNLDQKTGAAVLETFKQLNQQGKTIVLITHDLKVAASASRIIRILDGVIESDSASVADRKRALSTDMAGSL